MATKPEQTIDDYINGFPEAVRAIRVRGNERAELTLRLPMSF